MKPKSICYYINQEEIRKNIEYHNFHTLWIMTKVDGKWGIQFRSSFLDKASQTKNII